MANYSTLKAAVADVVKTNGSQAITGANLQTVLLSIINSIGGGGYIFNGVATPSTDAGTPDQNVFYIGGAGTYANFGTSVVVPPTNIAVFKYNGTWNCEQLTVENGGVFDISAYNNNTTYADLASALGTNGANVPESVRKGGMSVKFVQSSDNKYVQYRLMSDSFSTIVGNWQGVDEESTAGSNNLVKSNGVANQQSIIISNLYEANKRLDNYGSIVGYRVEDDNTIHANANATLYYKQISKGTIVKGLAVVGTVLIFKTEPTSSSVCDGFISSDKSFIMPFNGYVLITSGHTLTNSFGIFIRESDEILPIERRFLDTETAISETKDDLYEFQEVDGKINGYINSSGTNTSYSSDTFVTKYAHVNKGDKLIFAGKVNDNYRAGFLKKEPTVGFTLDKIIATDTTSPYIAEISGWFCISWVKELVSLKVASKTFNPISFGARDNNMGIVQGYVLGPNGVWDSSKPYFDSCYWSVQKGELVEITAKNSDSFANYAFFSSVPQNGSTPVSYSNGSETAVESPIDGYICFCRGVPRNTWLRRCQGLNKTLMDIQGQLEYKKYYNKNCLYIGDSISTKDIYHWKGMLEINYNLKYVLDISGQLAPANGGITIYPPENESQVPLEQKSIWYRCAENRMSIYNFDVISLFGGTNDMGREGLVVGTPNDIPYVDDASSFATPSNYTDVWSDSLTLAQCLMGCIEMLKRDFPSKEIILTTVYPREYGNENYPLLNIPISEAVAEMQVRVANKYQLRLVPLYWDVATRENAMREGVFNTDGVHPSYVFAQRIMAKYAETLCL